WEREAVLGGAVVLIEGDHADPTPLGDDARGRASSGAARLIERAGGLVVLAAREPRSVAFRPSVNFDVRRPTTNEQRAAWLEALGEAARTYPAAGAAGGAQFSMSLPGIRSAAAQAIAQAEATPGSDVAAVAWQICR